MSNEFIPQPKPEWANYLAQDGDGEWNWFDLQPEIIFDQCFGLMWCTYRDEAINSKSAGWGEPPKNPVTMLFHCDSEGNRTLVTKGGNDE